MVGRTHRGTAALQMMLEHAPATGGLALWMHHRDVAAGEIPGVIANDGATICYAPGFEKLDRARQVGWVAHQVLHVAFRHVQRRDDLRGLLGEIDETLFNTCADAIVNSALSHLTWLALPPRAARLETLLANALDIHEPVEKALLAWDVERLYRAVDDRREAAKRSSRRGQRREGEGSGTDRDDPDQKRTAVPRRQDGPKSARVRAMAGARDLLPQGRDEPAEAAAESTREWSERVRRGHADDGEFSMLRTLVRDLPRSRVPWERLLRVQLARALVHEPELSWSRPARSWLANRGRSPSGRRLPWEPGTVSSRSAARLCVVLDVSGSIDDRLLVRLTRELRAMTRRAEAEGVLVIGDDQVREVKHVRPGAWQLDGLDFEGGGGTDFEPLLAEAARHRPDLTVVLTDLEGHAGARPPYPVLWAVPVEHAVEPPPFGRLVVLDD